MRRKHSAALCLAALVAAFAPLSRAQTIQGMISGQVVDSITERPLAGSLIHGDGIANDLTRLVVSDHSGYFVRGVSEYPTIWPASLMPVATISVLPSVPKSVRVAPS